MFEVSSSDEFGIVDDGPTSYFLGTEVVRDMQGIILELHQQKYIRKTLLTFDEFLPKSKKKCDDNVLMHYMRQCIRHRFRTRFMLTNQ